MTSTRNALWARCLVCALSLGAAGLSAGCSGSPAPLSAETVAADDPSLDVDRERPTDAERLAHLLFYFQGIDKLRKAGYRESLGLDEAQSTAVLALADEVDALNTKAQGATDENADAYDELYNDLSERLGTELRKTMKPEQFNAMRVALLEAQIGATAFLMPGVPETLPLSNVQIAQISSLIEAHKDELKPRNFTFWNIRKVISLGRQLRAQAERLLDEEQTKRWQQVMSGELPIVE